MRSFISVAPLAAQVVSVLAQSQGVKYIDGATGLTFSSYTNEVDISINVAIPEATAAPFDVVLQVIAPKQNGWVGLAWGGTMTGNPLTVSWRNGQQTVVSSRMAFSLNVPQPYEGATYQLMKGSGVNDTHWTMTAFCQGCSQWLDVDSNPISLNPSGAASFSWAQAAGAVVDPSSNSSLFNAHDSHQTYSHDLSLGRNEDFAAIVARNILLLPGNSSTSAIPTPTPTTLSTTVASPTSSGVKQAAIPSSCAGVSNPRFASSIASGWRSAKIVGGLTTPRTILFDSANHLLVVQSGKGVTAHTIDASGCVSATKTVISQTNLNHGLALSPDGKTLYASSATTVWKWTYDPTTASISGSSTVLVKGMANAGHITRTLAVAPNQPNLLVVTHGSSGNFDYPTGNPAAGRAIVKVFDITSPPSGGFDYSSGGSVVGYGLRNAVGVTFDANNMLWEVENSGDDFRRTINGVSTDIHTDNPAEEINYLGAVSSLPSTPKWYGYPTCFTVGNPSTITDKRFSIGDQFVLAPNSTFNDDSCVSRSSLPPALTIQAHSAPLTGRFDANYTQMYVALHGSWNRQTPTGFKLISVPFGASANPALGGFGPTAALSSGTGYQDVWWNTNTAGCSQVNCFRPVGVEVDREGRVFVSSDAASEGELFILGKV